jgi:hypothetical protein
MKAHEVGLAILATTVVSGSTYVAGYIDGQNKVKADIQQALSNFRYNLDNLNPDGTINDPD